VVERDRSTANYATTIGASPDTDARAQPEHEGEALNQQRRLTMKKILIATDGSASSAEAVEFGVELAAEHEAAVIFVHVASATDVVPMAGYGMAGALPRVPHEVTEYDRASLEDAEQAATEHGVRTSMKLLVGNTVDEIVTYADNQDVDMIVVGSRGHGAFASALLGSVSRGILSESKRPVMIVRGQAAVPVGAS
jgi:nucleotide-binding universal stress UspA family protein